MALNEGQLVTYALDEIIETVQNLTPMASKVTKYTPPAESMQRSSNTVWMPVEQSANPDWLGFNWQCNRDSGTLREMQHGRSG